MSCVANMPCGVADTLHDAVNRLHRVADILRSVADIGGGSDLKVIKILFFKPSLTYFMFEVLNNNMKIYFPTDDMFIIISEVLQNIEI